MKDVVRETGLSRQTIHFYLAAGLLPQPRKTGRNTALYSAEHVRRARLIKDLQEKNFLPLRAIRVLLEDSSDSSLSAAQQTLIGELRVRLGPSAAAQDRQRVALRELCQQLAIPAAEVAEFRNRGIVSVEGAGAAASVSSEDAQLLHAWARLKAIGVSPQRGFLPRDVEIIENTISQLVRREMELFTERYASAGSDEAARVVLEAVPIVNQIIGIIHWKKTWAFFTEFEQQEASLTGRRRPQGE